jgi:hypothetical protein
MTGAADEAALFKEGSGFWLLPDHDDCEYAGRSAFILFTAAATAPQAVDQLRTLAAELAENGLSGGRAIATPIGEEVESHRDGLAARFGPRLTSEVAVLLLRLAVYQLRRAGLPEREELLVLTDPFEVE